MATDDSTHDLIKLKPTEIDALGDRMLARAISTLFEAQPRVRSDMFLCVGCLRELAREAPMDGLEVRVWRNDLI